VTWGLNQKIDYLIILVLILLDFSFLLQAECSEKKFKLGQNYKLLVIIFRPICMFFEKFQIFDSF